MLSIWVADSIDLGEGMLVGCGKYGVSGCEKGQQPEIGEPMH